MDYRTVRRYGIVLTLAALTVACSPTAPTGGGGGGGGGATVTSVSIGGTVAVSEGATSQLIATATKSDGTTENVTGSATWRSSDTTVATVSGTGLVTGVRTGSADITAAVGSQTGRSTVQVAVPRFLVSLSVQSVTALATCDDVLQGLTIGEFATRVIAIGPGGVQETLDTTPGYPGNPNNLLLYNLADGASASINESTSFTVNGASGQSVRVQFNATEWDEQIVIFPPSIRWIHDSRLDDETVSRTHAFANGTFGSLGPNTLTAGNSSCGIRLNYTISATRQ